MYLAKNGIKNPNQDQLLYHVDMKTGLESFLTWLTQMPGPVTLAGYNSHSYDDLVLYHNLVSIDKKLPDGTIFLGRCNNPGM